MAGAEVWAEAGARTAPPKSGYGLEVLEDPPWPQPEAAWGLAASTSPHSPPWRWPAGWYAAQEEHVMAVAALRARPEPHL